MVSEASARRMASEGSGAESPWSSGYCATISAIEGALAKRSRASIGRSQRAGSPVVFVMFSTRGAIRARCGFAMGARTTTLGRAR